MNDKIKRAIVEMTNRSFSYARDRGRNRILKNVNLRIVDHELVTIRGQSGSGKTTLALLLAGLLNPIEGAVLIHREPVRHYRASPVQIVFQDPYSAINPARTIEEWFAIAVRGMSLPFFRRADSALRHMRQELDSLFDMLSLSPKILSKHPTEVSGGECQRACIVATLLTRPSCIIFDEPVSMLDPSSKQAVVSAIEKVCNLRRFSIILISHETIEFNVQNTRNFRLEHGALIQE